MRDLSATNLTANSKSLERPPLLKLVLTKTSQTTRTYDISSSTNRIINLSHIEQEHSQIAHVAIQSDATLAALSLEGYTATLSYGYNDGTAGDEYSAVAPLEVMAQASNTVLSGRQARIITYFICAGVFDLMSAEMAQARYSQEDDDTKTIKDLLTAIAEATLAPFTHCKAYTITFDSEDSLIDTYIPADYFYVAAGESRLSAFTKLIKKAKCRARIENTAGVATIHVFNPTVSGTTYDYEYNDTVTNHNFFEKGVRKRLVLPNYVTVQSHPSHAAANQYSGYATDADSYAALGRYVRSEPYYIRATSNAQCTAIAAAILQNKQVESERGHGFAPMNCGQEVMDYIKITDSIAADTRTGNIGYILRQYTPGKKFSMEFRFGKLAGELPFMSMVDPTTGGISFEALMALEQAMQERLEAAVVMLLSIDTVPKWHVTKELRIPEAYN